MLSVELKVNGKKIGGMTITNTGQREDAGNIYRMLRLNDRQSVVTNGVELYVLHEPRDGAWMLLRKALERYEEIERYADSKTRSTGRGASAGELPRVPRGTDA